MCGIFGCFPRTRNTEVMLPFLAWEMERRGKHSWGCAGDGEVVAKEVGLITEKFDIWEKGGLVYHTRHATTGAITAENTHPFVAEGPAGRVVGVHNGCITNHGEMNRKYNRAFVVDSNHIMAHLAEGRSLEDLHGWGVVVYYLDGKFRFVKLTSNADLAMFRLGTGELVFASEKIPVLRAAAITRNEIKSEITVEAKVVYGLELEENNPMVKIVAVEKIEFDKFVYSTSNNSYSANNGNRVYVRDVCPGCNQNRINIDKQVVCEGCFVKIRNQVKNTGVAGLQPASYVAV